MSKGFRLKPVVCLMGPTATGKTELALQLAKQYPIEIISVDSSMIYRGMDIGTAKPAHDVRAQCKHWLIDIRDPCEHYSLGQFYQDACATIDDVYRRRALPLMVGGTMMYFRSMREGVSALPERDPVIREELDGLRRQYGLDYLYHKLQGIDPAAAEKIHASDPQRILRALEVWRIAGRPISELQNLSRSLPPWPMKFFAFDVPSRSDLHQKIAERFHHMLEIGLVEEVRKLYEQGDLTTEHSSVRSIGYRQIWRYLQGQDSYDEMVYKAIVATRQLAKRQLTWLRSWQDVTLLPPHTSDALEMVTKFLG